VFDHYYSALPRRRFAPRRAFFRGRTAQSA
jgi:hypothetical protein